MATVRPVSSDQICGICLDADNADDQKANHNNGDTHVYHRWCLAKWTDQKAICPECRAPLDVASLNNLFSGVERLARSGATMKRFAVNAIGGAAVGAVSSVFGALLSAAMVGTTVVKECTRGLFERATAGAGSLPQAVLGTMGSVTAGYLMGNRAPSNVAEFARGIIEPLNEKVAALGCDPDAIQSGLYSATIFGIWAACRIPRHWKKIPFIGGMIGGVVSGALAANPNGFSRIRSLNLLAHV